MVAPSHRIAVAQENDTEKEKNALGNKKYALIPKVSEEATFPVPFAREKGRKISCWYG